MRKMKKFMSLLLAAVMVLSVMTVNVFAEGENTKVPSIVIDNATPGATYTVYKMFDLSYNGANYSYKVTSDWEDFFAEDGAGADYITVEDDYVVENKMNGDSDLESAFTAAAGAYAKTLRSGISKVAGENEVTVTFGAVDGLTTLGYYVVTSTHSTGSLCMLTNTDPEGVIVDKNYIPQLHKKVKEGSDWADSNTADITEVVEFKITVVSEKNPEGYVVEDTMGNEWELVRDEDHPISVKHESNDWVDGTEYDLDVTGNDFTITFKTHANVADVNAYDEIVITYFAKLNANATIAGAGNKNNVILTHPDGEEDDDTTTYTWEIPVFKYTGDDTPLAGAEFILKNGSNYATFDNDGVFTGWDSEANATPMVSDANGKLYFKGLDSDDYKLVEKTAPEGYNKLADAIDITIDVDGNVSSATTIDDNDATEYVKVLNNTGAILPETGGIGTTIFRVGGAALIIVAGALLVAKKRTNNI